MYERIKELCKLNNVSINELEKKLGISKGSLCKIDSTDPGLSRIIAIAEYFSVNINYLVYGEKYDKPDPDEYDENIAEIAEYYTKFNKEQKNAILNLMRTFAL